MTGSHEWASFFSSSYINKMRKAKLPGVQVWTWQLGMHGGLISAATPDRSQCAQNTTPL